MGTFANRTPSIEVHGVDESVEIAVDRWGIPHIRARNLHDLFFAQGYAAARDRLWQIDLWRKRGLGLLAADFGPGYLAQDHASRLFLYRGDMAAEWAAYGEDSEAICSAFAAGINAYVGRIEQGEESLPPEFSLLETRPSRWKAEDVVRIRSHCLTRNAISEIVRANVLARAGAKADALRKQLEPDAAPFADPAVPLSEIPLAAIDVFKLATASVSFSRERLAATLAEAGRWNRVNTLGDVVMESETQGSNNWAIAPERTATGRPIMASDPHRTHAVPALRYLVHLTMPGFDAIGAGEPCVPGITIGHNERIAFSVTISGADQEDVYFYETRPEDRRSYRYADGWEDMTVVDETFEVKGHPPQVLPLCFTRHGPVLFEDPENNRAYAMRTVWTEPGSAPYMSSLKVMRAQSYEEYRQALRDWGTPSMNHLYADVDGNIAWQAIGKAPIRRNWNGLLPVPGDGRYEWDGFIASEDMPSSTNPERGFLATANEMNIPEEWNATNPAIGYEWIDASRAQRIHRVLDGQPAHALADSCRLQNDLYTVAGERAKAVLKRMSFACETASRAADLILGWDCVAGPRSSAAALFEIWVTAHLKPALYTAFAQDEKIRPLLQPGDIQSVLAVLERPQEWFGGDATETSRQIAESTLDAAWRDCQSRLGDDHTQWQWGKVHRLRLDHAVAAAFPEMSAEFDIEPIEVGGTGSTPMYGSYRPSDFVNITGPSVRLVMDVGGWDNSLFVNLPGQSGNPASPHYRDLTEAWLNGEYMQLAYSASAVDAVTASRMLLVRGK
ncbi:MAG TPA: penicillin acylase family protein [Rhizobiaceae bacterium]|nr:penicillin acylase family protein [Rhizobiaceae bacterium]